MPDAIIIGTGYAGMSLTALLDHEAEVLSFWWHQTLLAAGRIRKVFSQRSYLINF
jgi:hypothetical protein